MLLEKQKQSRYFSCTDLVTKVNEDVMELQVVQNISDTVSPLDKMLLERKEECWLMLNKTFVTTSVTTTAPGKTQLAFLYIDSLVSSRLGICCCMCLVIAEA
jgi:hypothetical protein